MLKIMRKGVYLLTAILYVMLFSASLADASVTWVCPTCGNVNRGNFCPVDGTEKPRAWICESCRSLNNQNFCERCGAAQSGINVDFTITFDGASMADSFMDGDLLAFKTADPAELQRFDVVASLYPGRGDTLFVKRLIAFPGETFEIADGYVYIDGNKYDEPFVNDDYRVKGGSNGYSFAEIDVPKNGDTLTLEYTDENRNRVAVYIGGKMWSWRGVSSRSIAEDGTVLKYDKDGSLLINGGYIRRCRENCFAGRKEILS